MREAWALSTTHVSSRRIIRDFPPPYSEVTGMPNPNILVDNVSSLSSPMVLSVAGPGQPARHVVTVSFQQGRSAHLDMTVPRSKVWTEVLHSLRQANEPAYVELDPATNVITNLLCPLTVRVGAITPNAAGDAVEVELIISHARHHLRRAHADFQQMLQTLQDAKNRGTPVVVTETMNDHEIIDVRPLPNPPMPAVQVAPPASNLSPFMAITPQQAQQYYDLVNAKLCCPANPTAPCIPFLYPDDGCWGRAHEMCRLMLAAGGSPGKIWIYGSLHVKTANNPSCKVDWGWHVAPTLQVQVGSSTQVYVIDPALFSGPVTQATWASVQGDPNPALEPSDASVFYRGKGGIPTQYDPTYSQTNQVLTTYRNQLKLRSAGPDGPPPYVQCLVKPPGVQWYGTVAPHATHTWFTWGWPAAWHVIWTIMPLTPCPGAGQLSWVVQVERANSTQCTYWITVKNLTGDPVVFEGRYDVLSH
jgi:hypothetical protein